MKEGVETKGDEYSPVGWKWLPFEARNNYFGQILKSRICGNVPGYKTHLGYKWKIVDDIVQDI